MGQFWEFQCAKSQFVCLNWNFLFSNNKLLMRKCHTSCIKKKISNVKYWFEFYSKFGQISHLLVHIIYCFAHMCFVWKYYFDYFLYVLHQQHRVNSASRSTSAFVGKWKRYSKHKLNREFQIKFIELSIQSISMKRHQKSCFEWKKHPKRFNVKKRRAFVLKHENWKCIQNREMKNCVFSIKSCMSAAWDQW